MPRLESVAKFTVPLGGQEIELQGIAFETGGPESVSYTHLTLPTSDLV